MTYEHIYKPDAMDIGSSQIPLDGSKTRTDTTRLMAIYKSVE